MNIITKDKDVGNSNIDHTPEQTATDRLRAMLDERGVEYKETSFCITRVYFSDRFVTFYDIDGGLIAEVTYPRPVLGGTVRLTPEQAIAATLGSGREKRLEKLVRIYGEISNYFCERFACCDAEFANCKYCIGLPQGGQCELGWCNDESKALGIEQPDYGGGKCEPVNLQELYDRICELEAEVIEAPDTIRNELEDGGLLTPEDERCETRWHKLFGTPEPDGWYKCPDCGCAVGYTELYGGGWSIMLDDYQIPFNACPQCGKAVKR